MVLEDHSWFVAFHFLQVVNDGKGRAPVCEILKQNKLSQKKVVENAAKKS